MLFVCASLFLPLVLVTGCAPSKSSGTKETEASNNSDIPNTTEAAVSAAEQKLGLGKYIPLTTYKTRPGLYVEDGRILHEGKEFYGIGVNFYGAFSNYFTGAQPEFEGIFAKLAENGIKFCRINIGLYWPVDYKLWEQDNSGYYEKLDEVIHSAEKHGIGIISSFFWNMQGVSDYFDEPQNAWGNPDSKTRAYMAEYVEIIVNRYMESPSMWGYEFGNEINLSLDLPNAAELRDNTIHTELGTRAARDKNDDLTSDIATPLLEDFASRVKALDKYGRMVTSGSAEPRPSQYNQKTKGSWDRDTFEQMSKALEFCNPAPMDMVSIHVYELLDRFLKPEENSYANLFKAYQEASLSQGKALFIGEFYGKDLRCEDIIDAIVSTNVQLSAVWAIGSVEHSLSQEAERERVVLDYIKQANIQLMPE